MKIVTVSSPLLTQTGWCNDPSLVASRAVGHVIKNTWGSHQKPGAKDLADLHRMQMSIRTFSSSTSVNLDSKSDLAFCAHLQFEINYCAELAPGSALKLALLH